MSEWRSVAAVCAQGGFNSLLTAAPERLTAREVRALFILGHLEKIAFCDFFEIATSCNSLDYRELQHRIFKVTSKN